MGVIAEQTKAGTGDRRPARCAAISACARCSAGSPQLPTDDPVQHRQRRRTRSPRSASRTNRDGTLSLDASRLQSALAADPDGVEALFNPTQYSSSPFLTVKSAIGKVAPGHLQGHRHRLPPPAPTPPRARSAASR